MNKEATAIFVDKFFIDYKEVEFERIFSDAPESKQIPGKAASEQYQECTDKYKALKDGKESVEEFRFRGPIMYSKYGVSKKIDEKSGGVSYSIYSPLPVSKEEEAEKYVKFLDSLFEKQSEITEKYCVKFSCPKFKAHSAESAGIKPLYRFSQDKNTKEYHYDRDPHIYSKLVSSFDKRTIFVGIDKKIIPWSRLENVEMKFIPVYTLGIYKGGMGFSYTMKMVEATVLFFRKTNATSSQEKTIDENRERYMEEYHKSLETIGMNENFSTSTLGSVFDEQESEKEAKDKEMGEEDSKKESKKSTRKLI